MRDKRIIFLILLSLPLIAIFSQCLSKKEVTDPRGPEFAGAKTCISCHKDINNSYLHTAHYMASLPATPGNIHGSFSPGSNKLQYNQRTYVMLEKQDSGYYQTDYVNGQKVQSARFDITMGGVKGESYLYWNGNELFQLPVSYDINLRSWIRSPGYDTSVITYDRAITMRCLECHSSYAKAEKPNVPSFGGLVEGFEKNSLILGVDCERCHGPAAQHVNFHTENPAVKTSKFIVTQKSLTRTQKIDLCGTCHIGTNTVTSKSIFNFRPGDKLADYKNHPPSEKPVDYGHIDVHGDQKDMLGSSKCFISSKMDCGTCHNTHTNERNDLLLYAQRCMNCHTTASHNDCKLTNTLSAGILKAKCISCHMPALPTSAIVNQNKSVLVRTHHIAIYPTESKRALGKK